MADKLTDRQRGILATLRNCGGHATARILAEEFGGDSRGIAQTLRRLTSLVIKTDKGWKFTRSGAAVARSL